MQRDVARGSHAVNDCLMLLERLVYSLLRRHLEGLRNALVCFFAKSHMTGALNTVKMHA